MKKFFLLIPLLVLAFPGQVAKAQSTTRIEWDYKPDTVANVATYSQLVRVDNVAVTAVPTCVQVGPDVTCSVPVTLAAGTHSVSVRATKNSVSNEMTINGMNGANGPKNPEGIRININVTVTIP